MNDEKITRDEKNSITLQDIEYENELLGLGRPAVLVSLLSDRQRLAWILMARDE